MRGNIEALTDLPAGLHLPRFRGAEVSCDPWRFEVVLTECDRRLIGVVHEQAVPLGRRLACSRKPEKPAPGAMERSQWR